MYNFNGFTNERLAAAGVISEEARMDPDYIAGNEQYAPYIKPEDPRYDKDAKGWRVVDPNTGKPVDKVWSVKLH